MGRSSGRALSLSSKLTRQLIPVQYQLCVFWDWKKKRPIRKNEKLNRESTNRRKTFTGVDLRTAQLSFVNLFFLNVCDDMICVHVQRGGKGGKKNGRRIKEHIVSAHILRFFPHSSRSGLLGCRRRHPIPAGCESWVGRICWAQQSILWRRFSLPSHLVGGALSPEWRLRSSSYPLPPLNFPPYTHTVHTTPTDREEGKRERNEREREREREKKKRAYTTSTSFATYNTVANRTRLGQHRRSGRRRRYTPMLG